MTEAALRAYEALGCTGFSRVDLMLGPSGPEVLEVNAIPGLTDTSLLPQAAEAAGMEFEQLVERILELALERAPRRLIRTTPRPGRSPPARPRRGSP